MSDHLSIIPPVREYLATRIPEGSPLEDQTKLVSSGMIDSVGLVDLTTFLEVEFSIMISEESFTVDNFDTLTAIEALVTQLRSAK